MAGQARIHAGIQPSHAEGVALVMAGTLRVVLRDGSQQDFPAGDVMLLPPAHDAWTVGDQACTLGEFSKGNDYYRQGSAFRDARASRPVPVPPVKGDPP